MRNALVRARETPGAFVEYVDELEQGQIVTGVMIREGEDFPVAQLACGGFVALADADPADFRIVKPAIPSECPGIGCVQCPASAYCPTAAAVFENWNGGPIPLKGVADPQPAGERCAKCDGPTSGGRVGPCPKRLRLVVVCPSPDGPHILPAVGS